jgi:hypothetical protein
MPPGFPPSPPSRQEARRVDEQTAAIVGLWLGRPEETFDLFQEHEPLVEESVYDINRKKRRLPEPHHPHHIFSIPTSSPFVGMHHCEQTLRHRGQAYEGAVVTATRRVCGPTATVGSMPSEGFQAALPCHVEMVSGPGTPAECNQGGPRLEPRLEDGERSDDEQEVGDDGANDDVDGE